MTSKLSMTAAALVAFLLPASGMAATVVTDLNTTLTENGSFQQVFFDINGDSIDDISTGFFSSGTAYLSGATNYDPTTVDSSNIGIPVARNAPVLPLFGSFNAMTSQTRFLFDESSIPSTFSAGDSIDESDVSLLRSSMDLYGGRNNALPNVGDTGIFGVQITVGLGNWNTDDGVYFTGFEAQSEVETFYGFVTVEHGSIILSNAGASNVSGQAAIVGGTTPPPAVPLPASAWLLGAGLAGLGALRRARKS